MAPILMRPSRPRFLRPLRVNLRHGGPADGCPVSNCGVQPVSATPLVVLSAERLGAQGLSRTLIEPQGDAVEVALGGYARSVGSSRGSGTDGASPLACSFVAALRGAARITEVERLSRLWRNVKTICGRASPCLDRRLAQCLAAPRAACGCAWQVQRRQSVCVPTGNLEEHA